MLNPQHIFEKKSTLFGIVFAGVIGILAVPIILPHLFHGYHIAYIGVHIGGITLAAFLLILSIMSYRKLKTKRLLFTMLAFGIFISAETAFMIDATWPSLYDIGNISLVETGHLLIFMTLGLFALGVFRND